MAVARGAARRVQQERSHSREWRPSLVTRRSEKNPPASTPNDPPRQEARREGPEPRQRQGEEERA